MASTPEGMYACWRRSLRSGTRASTSVATHRPVWLGGLHPERNRTQHYQQQWKHDGTCMLLGAYAGFTMHMACIQGRHDLSCAHWCSPELLKCRRRLVSLVSCDSRASPSSVNIEQTLLSCRRCNAVRQATAARDALPAWQERRKVIV